MKNHKKALFLGIFGLISMTAICQDFIEEAVIITHNGDSTQGFIKNKDWKKNPKQIQFGSSRNAEFQTYKAIDVDGFYVKSSKALYHAVVTQVDKSSLKEIHIINGINQGVIEVDSVFLQTVVLGRVSLYHMIDENHKEHFFARKDGKIEELQLIKRRISTSIPTIATGELYKEQLDAFMVDYPDMQKDIERCKYSFQPLKSLVTKYNEHFSELSYAVVTEKAHVEFGLFAGATLSKLSLSGTPYVYEFGNFKPGISAFGGISLLVVLPRNHRSWAINSEIIYRTYNIEDKYTGTQLKLVNNFRYRFPKRVFNHRFYLGAGITNAIAIDWEVYPRTLDYRNHEQGYILEAGLGGKVSYFIRGESTNGFSPYALVKAAFKNVYAGVGYTFGQVWD